MNKSTTVSFPSLAAVAAVVGVALGSGCSTTTITALTQAPPGREATLDIVDNTVTLSRGLAMVFECSESTPEGYRGPCRDLDVDIDFDVAPEAEVEADDAVEVFDADLDALAGTTISDFDDGTGLTAPVPRRGIVLTAAAVGDGTITFETDSGPPVELVLAVVEPQ